MKDFFYKLSNMEASNIVFSLVIVIGTFIVASLFNSLFKRFVQNAAMVTKKDPTNYVFLRHLIRGMIYVVGFCWALYNIETFRSLANSLLAGAGILAVIAGLASQHSLSNIMSGLFLIIFKPFRVNDRVIIRDKYVGTVEDITLRHTVIRDFENRRIIIPNTIISDDILINVDYASSFITKYIEIHITQESDTVKAMAILQNAILEHQYHVDVRSDEDIEKGVSKAPVKVIGFSDRGIMIRGYAWVLDASKGFDLACDVYEKIKPQFDENGIQIAVQPVAVHV